MQILNPHDPIVSIALESFKRKYEEALAALGEIPYTADYETRQAAIRKKDKAEKEYWRFKGKVR